MNTLIQNIIQPLVTRIGTAAASALIAYGMAKNDAVTVSEAITVVGLFGLDLGLRAIIKRGGK